VQVQKKVQKKVDMMYKDEDGADDTDGAEGNDACVVEEEEYADAVENEEEAQKKDDMMYADAGKLRKARKATKATKNMSIGTNMTEKTPPQLNKGKRPKVHKETHILEPRTIIIGKNFKNFENLRKGNSDYKKMVKTTVPKNNNFRTGISLLRNPKLTYSNALKYGGYGD